MNTDVQTCLLLGNPVGHSLSPLIHNTAFLHLNLPVKYKSVLVETGELEKFVRQIDGTTVLGANVTIPYKQVVIGFLDDLTEVARSVGAVNSIFMKEGRLTGHNTDVEGFLAPLRDLVLEGVNVLVLGAGGAARAVLVALRHHAGVGDITVIARDLNKARAMCRDLGIGLAIPTAELPDTVLKTGLIVNATPVGMGKGNDASPLPVDARLTPGHIVYDLIYVPSETRLMRVARSRNARVLGGLPMLIAQAAAAFKLWTGREMPVGAVERAINEHLQASSSAG